MTRLFTSVGVARDQAVALSDRIQDWREPNAGKRLTGAVAADYLAAGLDYRPRHRPFQTVDELKLVLGMTPDLFARVAPALTVYSHRGTVNTLTAPRQVLLALGAHGGTSADQLIANRASDSDAANAPLGTAPTTSLALTGWAFTIKAAVQMPSGNVYRHEAVIRITNDPNRPYWTHLWREVPAE